MGEVTVADVLDRAADLIEPEGAWTQGFNARDIDGRGTYAFSSSAVCFCMAGALIRASGEAYPKELVKALFPVLGESKDWPIAWNDAPERTQAEVVSKLREAAALARSTPPTGEGQ